MNLNAQDFTVSVRGPMQSDRLLEVNGRAIVNVKKMADLLRGGRPHPDDCLLAAAVLDAMLADATATITPGADLIAKERWRQLNVEGWTPEHDDAHDDASLALAALCYAAAGPLYLCDIDSRATVRFVDLWPDSWDHRWDKRSQYGNADETYSGIADPDSYTHAQRIDLLAKAGALIAAEIDRLQRAQVNVEQAP